MEISVIDFTALGLAADWPSLRWIETLYGRRGHPALGVRLGHAGASAMVLISSYPRARLDEEAAACGFDPLREIAFETTYTQVNLVLHQITDHAARPDGLIGSLVGLARQQADRYREWSVTRWSGKEARTVGLASWQSGFSAAWPEFYVTVHACGVGIDDIELTDAGDLSDYEFSGDPAEPGAMHWELWPSRPDVRYDELAESLATSS